MKKEEFSKDKTKKTVIKYLEEARGLIQLNRFNLQKLFGNFELKNRNVWYTYETAIAAISDLLFFTDNLNENEK